jgi:hypothetical protein
VPIANRKILGWDKAKGRGYMSGKDVTWTGEDVNTHIEKWMRDMGMFVDKSDIVSSGRLDECIIAGGMIGSNLVLAKNRDRTYKPTIEIIRYISRKGIEIVAMYDKNTQYIEGMNEFGIGVVNSTMLNNIDSDAQENYNSVQGKIIFKALNSRTLDEAIGILSSHSGGLEGHTIVSDPLRMFHVELLKNAEAHVEQINPMTGWDARTNHGIRYPEGGYMPADGQLYMSSNYRKAQAEIELSTSDSLKNVFKCLRQQHNEPQSHMNLHRRVPGDNKYPGGFSTTNQLVMDLSALEFHFHCYPDYCDFQGIKDLTSDDYEPKIKIKTTESDH